MDIVRPKLPLFNDSPVPLAEKHCSKCDKVRPIALFYVRNSNKPHKLYGYSPWCKDCYCKHVRSTYNSEVDRYRHIEKTYGITAEEYDNMFRLQMGVCAICGDPPRGRRPLVVDHEHGTGIIRELLCDRCNAMLGCARDNMAVLKKARAYLKKHSS